MYLLTPGITFLGVIVLCVFQCAGYKYSRNTIYRNQTCPYIIDLIVFVFRCETDKILYEFLLTYVSCNTMKYMYGSYIRIAENDSALRFTRLMLGRTRNHSKIWCLNSLYPYNLSYTLHYMWPDVWLWVQMLKWRPLVKWRQNDSLNYNGF